MNDAEIRNLVAGWHARAKSEHDDISRFVFLWFCFNAWLTYESGQDYDRQMITWLTTGDGAFSQLRMAFESASTSDDFSLRLLALAELTPISDTSPRRRSSVGIASTDDFIGLVESLYRVRCNLFHGSKDPANPRDQRLIRASLLILDSWIMHLVERWQIDGQGVTPAGQM